MEFLDVVYHLDADADEAAALANSVLLEQTVETPAEVAARTAFVRDHMMGSIRELAPDPAGGFRLALSLPIVTAQVDPAQFLNVLFGNASLHDDLRLETFDLPPTLRKQFPGPRFGIEGLRRQLGVQGRPLTCSALKPVGLPLDDIAALCRTFATGGLDLIKDDHYLGDHPFCTFEERVTACQAAVEDVAARTGHRAVYVPNLSGTPDAVRRQLDFAQAAGVGAVMLAPMLLGLPFVHELVQQRLRVPLLVHPSFAGTDRIRPATLYGRLFRMFGADAVIFPNYGGRFSYTPETCRDIAERLREPWQGYAGTFPVPAGGMKVERALELVEFFGLDTVLLIGGSLLQAEADLLARTQAFREAVSRAALTFST